MRRIIVALFFVFVSFDAFGEQIPLNGINQSGRTALSGQAVVCANPKTGLLESCGGGAAASSVTQTQTTVNTASVVVSASNILRANLFFFNAGTTILYLRVDGSPSTIASGIALFPSQSRSLADISGSGARITGAVTAISDVASGSLVLVETNL